MTPNSRAAIILIQAANGEPVTARLTPNVGHLDISSDPIENLQQACLRLDREIDAVRKVK